MPQNTTIPTTPTFFHVSALEHYLVWREPLMWEPTRTPPSKTSSRAENRALPPTSSLNNKRLAQPAPMPRSTPRLALETFGHAPVAHSCVEGRPRRPSLLNPLGLPAPLTTRQLLCVYG